MARERGIGKSNDMSSVGGRGKGWQGYEGSKGSGRDNGRVEARERKGRGQWEGALKGQG